MVAKIKGSGTTSFDGNLTVSGSKLEHGSTTNVSRKYVLNGTTTNATETEITTIDNTQITINANTTLLADILIVARRTDATGESAGFRLNAVADNYGGTTADVGNVYEIIFADDSGNLEIDARANDTDDALHIYVTGEANKTIKWTAHVTTIEVAQ